MFVDQTGYANIQSSTANIASSSANIQTGQANIGPPIDARTADETRPGNMRVVYIIKIQHAGWTPDEEETNSKMTHM